MTRSFEFGGSLFEIAGDAALYWPQEGALLVSDLHLEKASAYAANGQMLPPYDSLHTLEEVAALAQKYRPAKIISLGDNFHDDDGEVRLSPPAAALLRELTANQEWCWISGNHDRAVSAKWGGRSFAEIDMSGIYLRHEACKGEQAPEISGHFHPKYRQFLRGRMVSRRCFIKCERKLIMPAFGALTGGLDATHVAILNACDLTGSEQAEAVVPTRTGLACFALGSSVSFAK